MKITFQLLAAGFIFIGSKTFAKPTTIPGEYSKNYQDTTKKKKSFVAKKSDYDLRYDGIQRKSDFVLSFDDATQKKIESNRSEMFIKKDTIKGALLRVVQEAPPEKKETK